MIRGSLLEIEVRANLRRILVAAQHQLFAPTQPRRSLLAHLLAVSNNSGSPARLLLTSHFRHRTVPLVIRPVTQHIPLPRKHQESMVLDFHLRLEDMKMDLHLVIPVDLRIHILCLLVITTCLPRMQCILPLLIINHILCTVPRHRTSNLLTIRTHHTTIQTCLDIRMLVGTKDTHHLMGRVRPVLEGTLREVLKGVGNIMKVIGSPPLPERLLTPQEPKAPMTILTMMKSEQAHRLPD